MPSLLKNGNKTKHSMRIIIQTSPIHMKLSQGPKRILYIREEIQEWKYYDTLQ